MNSGIKLVEVVYIIASHKDEDITVKYLNFPGDSKLASKRTTEASSIVCLEPLSSAASASIQVTMLA